jgi:hypothetical protein
MYSDSIAVDVWFPGCAEAPVSREAGEESVDSRKGRILKDRRFLLYQGGDARTGSGFASISWNGNSVFSGW